MKPELLRQVKKSLRELIEDVTDTARIHHAQFNRATKTYDFSDEIWRGSHERSWRVARHACALVSEQKEGAACTTK